MIIKENEQLRYNSGFKSFFPFEPGLQSPIYLIITFFRDGFSHLKGGGELNFMQRIEKMLQHGIGFENVRVAIDNLNNLVYINEIYYDKNKPTTDTIEKLLDEENEIELCKIGFLEHVILTKENFLHIILSWDKASTQQSPFALLYQDENGWFDILPFNSSEAMEKFVADHTQQEVVQK